MLNELEQLNGSRADVLLQRVRQRFATKIRRTCTRIDCKRPTRFACQVYLRKVGHLFLANLGYCLSLFKVENISHKNFVYR